MPQINTDAWGEGFWLSDDYLNKRTGTSSITDQDYTDFQPFAFMSRELLPPSPNVNTVCLQKLYSLGMCQLNEPLDGSICYVGMYNSDLPQLNIGVFYAGDTQDEPTFKTDNTQIQSFFLYSNLELFGYFQPTNQYMPNGMLVKPSYSSGTPSKYLNWSDDGYTGTGYNTDVDAMKQYNTNLKIDPVLKFGVKSLFLVIYVVYISSLDGSGQPISTQTTLNDYLNGVGHDDTWKTQHPVMCAYAVPFIRRNINGEYNSQVISGADICPAFTLSLNGIDGDTEHNIIQYMSATKGAAYSNTLDSCFPIYGNITPKQYNIPYAGSTEFSAPIYLGIDHGEYKKAPNNDIYWFELDLTDPDNVEYLMRGCAAYGLFFADDYYTLAQSGRDIDRWIDNNMCCGTIDENGRTNGDYTRGLQNMLQRQFDWSDSTESPFDPLLPPEPENTYSTQTVFNQIGDLTTMTHRYVLEAGAVENLGTALWTITSDLTIGQTDYSELNQKILDTFQSSNPIDCIVSLQRYPMNIPKADSTLVKLGNYETVIPAHTMEKTVYVYLFEMKNKILPLFYDSFLDYEPYTHFELYVPFCGTTSIEPADILNRKLAVQLVVDFTTGTCTGYIMSDNLVIKTVNGQIAIDIPVSGLQQITAASQINNAIATAAAAQKQEIAATLGTVSISGITSLILNPVKTLTNGQIAQINAQKAEYDLQHQNIQPHIIGAATSAAAWAIDLNCRLLIYYPTGEVITDTNPPAMKGQKLAEYGHTIGFACCLTGQLQDFSGLTVAVNADLNGITTNGLTARPATAQELQMLEAALNEGIII